VARSAQFVLPLISKASSGFVVRLTPRRRVLDVAANLPPAGTYKSPDESVSGGARANTGSATVSSSSRERSFEETSADLA
jgi:hypothetical protein